MVEKQKSQKTWNKIIEGSTHISMIINEIIIILPFSIYEMSVHMKNKTTYLWGRIFKRCFKMFKHTLFPQWVSNKNNGCFGVNIM